MGYLTDHRADIRADPRRLLPSARSIICIGKLYNGPELTRPGSTVRSWLDLRYAWGDDYHDILRAGLERLAAKLGPDHEWRVCVTRRHCWSVRTPAKPDSGGSARTRV